jgi:caspase domain-containing protein
MEESMKRHALLIGSQILGLRGPHNDVQAMAVLLSQRGFEIKKCTEAGASRAGILEAYRALIDVADKDDPVVIYYSGHGGYAEDKTGRRVQYILPTDWGTDENTFNGIVDAELSDLLAQLTGKTTNVTVILDCCHSSLLSRGADDAPPEFIARAVPGKWTKGLESHMVNAPARLHITGNPHAVRLVACEADREAFEADHDVNGQHVRRGIFTRALQQILEESGSAALSWRGLCNRLREHVLSRARMQRPSVEGPADRVLFTTSEQTRPDAVVYFEHEGKPALRASQLLGARVGIQYDVVRRGEISLTANSRVASATITTLDGSKALVSLTDVKEPPKVGALAFPKKSPFPAMPAALVGPSNPDLHKRLSASVLIDVTDREATRFVVETIDDKIVLTDHVDGVSSLLRLGNDSYGHAIATQWIERWAKAEALRALPPGGLAHNAIELTWGCAVNSELQTRGRGDRFRVGEKICLYAKNASQQHLYMWIIDIGVFGKVTIVSVAAEGQAIASGGRISLGDDNGVPVGLELEWPEDHASDLRPRRESLLVLAANHWVDVSVFETPTLQLRARGDRGSALEGLLRSLGTGTTRDLSAPNAGQVYGVQRIDFDLDPRPASASGW